MPWGHIACKWLGSKNIQPIICMHGWQDNAGENVYIYEVIHGYTLACNCNFIKTSGTFDLLLPHLPNHLSYLIIEFPGHGLSSPIPHGMIYTYATFLYVLLFVINKFNWKRVSLLGHSLGAMVSYTFASTFPDRCDMVVGVDLIRPDTLTKTFDVKFLLRDINHLYVADQRNQENSEPPSYTYDNLVKKRHANKEFPMNIESVPFILYRGVKPSKSDPNKYYFSCDGRLKQFEILIPVKAYDDIATRIVSPFCFIKARHSLFPESAYAHIIENMKSNAKFEYHMIDGGHHVHLDNAKAVGEVVTKFIEKYHRPVVSKL